MWLYLLPVVLLGLYFLFCWYREREMVQNLQNKYVLITGCDSGFGNLLAHKLDQRGMRVLAGCLTNKAADRLNQTTSLRLQTVIVDVTNSGSVAAMTQWVTRHIGDKGLWGLVNNAGISIPGAPNGWLTKYDFQTVLNVNLLGLIDVTLHMTPLVRKAQGRIVNVSSFGGRISFVGGAYCISKYGVEAFSDSLRRELKPFGVKVIMIEPGFFNTKITDDEILQSSVLRAWYKSPLEVQQSYGTDYLDVYLKNLTKQQTLCSSNLSLVIDCMEHSLLAQHPRTRYSAGWHAKLLYVPLSYCPTAWADVLLSQPHPKPSHQL